VNGQSRFSLGDFAKDLRNGKNRNEWRSSWATVFLYRLPGAGLAWGCARLGVKPLTVTLVALLVALSLPVLALWSPLAFAPLSLVIAGALFQILDCADGTLARQTGQTSQTGADLDFLIDMAQWAMLYLALGILADRIMDTGWALSALGAIAAWARLMARVIRDRLDDGVVSDPAPLKLLGYPAAFLGGISGLIPFLALSGSWIGVGIAALMAYSLLDIAEALMPLAQRK